jgi:hypothetical protein
LEKSLFSEKKSRLFPIIKSRRVYPMKGNTAKLIFWILIIMAGWAGLKMQAQEKAEGVTSAQIKQDVLVHTWEGATAGAAFMGEEPFMIPLSHTSANMQFISSEFEPVGKPVKGAPYSAEIISESIQTLSDGNHITHKSNSAIYRDSEGRTRREQNFANLGGLAAEDESMKIIFINDPVAGINYILHPNKTANRIMIGKSHINALALEGKPGSGVEVSAEAVSTDARQFHAEKKIIRHEGSSSFENSKKESLGTQNIEGVKAEGSRVTIVIPAGEIGNELPITIVSETWYSPELQTVVVSKNSDPRMGDNSYRLTNINRNEPARSLFEVPADYKIEEGKQQIMIHKEIKQ